MCTHDDQASEQPILCERCDQPMSEQIVRELLPQCPTCRALIGVILSLEAPDSTKQLVSLQQSLSNAHTKLYERQESELRRLRHLSKWLKDGSPGLESYVGMIIDMLEKEWLVQTPPKK